MTPAPPPAVAAVFRTCPASAEARLTEVREIIFAAAQGAGIAALEETLKWGQPSYLPVKKRIGTTLRLGWSDSRVTLFVPCQTDLVDRYRARFPEEFTYEGNRAVHIPVEGALETEALHQMAAMALTYHRDKRTRS